MKTLPPGTFDEHVYRLLDFLRSRVSNIDGFELRFFGSGELKRGEGTWLLARTALRELDDYRVIFEQLCSEGREWINLAGAGGTPEGLYLVSVEYSSSIGRQVTAVNVSGPPLNANGSPMSSSYIQLV